MENWLCFTFIIILLAFFIMCQAKDVTVYSGHLGENLTVVCPYQRRADRYRRKLWCKESGAGFCETVVSSHPYLPLGMPMNGSINIEDNTSEGFVTINFTNLQKENSGLYQCRTQMLGDVSILQWILVNVLEDIAPHNDSELDNSQYSVSRSQSGLQFTLTLFVLGGSILVGKMLITGMIYIWWKIQEIKHEKKISRSILIPEERLYAGVRYEELMFSSNSEPDNGPNYINYMYQGHLNQAPWQE